MDLYSNHNDFIISNHVAKTIINQNVWQNYDVMNKIANHFLFYLCVLPNNTFVFVDHFITVFALKGILKLFHVTQYGFYPNWCWRMRVTL